MAFRDRITAIFKRAPKPEQPEQPLAAPAPNLRAEPQPVDAAGQAVVQARQERAIQEVGDSLERIGGLLGQLDRNLIASAEQAAAGTQAMVEAAHANRSLADTMREHLQRRDEAQAAIIERLRAFDETLREQRAHEQRQFEQVLGVQRASRRLLVLALLGAVGLGLLFLFLLLALLLRPDLIGKAPTAAAPSPSPAALSPDPVQTLLKEAQSSPDPAIAAAAARITEAD